jgi:hypothetical protein
MIDRRDQEALVAYLDDELTPEERAAVVRRLGEDAEYAAELESLREVDALLDLYPAPEPRGDLAERVLARAGGLGRRLRLLRPVLAAAASLLVVATIIVALNREGPEPTPPGPAPTAEEAIENLEALEYLALVEEFGEDADAILEDPGLLEDTSAILALAGEGSEDG